MAAVRRKGPRPGNQQLPLSQKRRQRTSPKVRYAPPVFHGCIPSICEHNLRLLTPDPLAISALLSNVHPDSNSPKGPCFPISSLRKPKLFPPSSSLLIKPPDLPITSPFGFKLNCDFPLVGGPKQPPPLQRPFRSPGGRSLSPIEPCIKIKHSFFLQPSEL